jgi:hypothetical protein
MVRNASEPISLFARHAGSIDQTDMSEITEQR